MKLHVLVACLLAGLSACSAPARAGTAEAVPVEGPRFRAELAAVDGSGTVTFFASDRQRKFAAADLVRWGTFAEPAGEIQVLLADGGVLVAENVEAGKDRLTADTALFGRVSMPIERAAGILFRSPLSPPRRDRLAAKVLAPDGETDRLFLDNGDEVRGTILAIAPSGTAGADRPPVVEIETEAGSVRVLLEKIDALAFNPALVARAAKPGPRIVVGFRDGSRWTAAAVSVDKAKASLDIAAGLRIEAPAAALVALEPLGGRATYLSELRPAVYRQTPFLDIPWDFRPDGNVLGGALRAGGKLYLKGLGVHSRALVTYKLEKPWKRFEADVAVDDAAAGRGSVVFRVLVDGREQYASPIVRGGEPPTAVSVGLAGAKEITLVVDYADHGDELDYADWLNARFVP
ncbi:MAG: NPCBM/NEW2 domain-containing protein [Pirellulales bacterium]